MKTLPVFAISRHRMITDGAGVTALVAAMGCPLKCRYCINAEALEKAEYTTDKKAKWKITDLTPEELYDRVKIDDLYFRATNGGVCFGGGESLLHSEFIEDFSRLVDGRWKITVETSLNISTEIFRRVLPFVDEFIVDIKDMNSDIYREYTGLDNSNVINNLRILADFTETKKIRIRIPRIPNYNTDDDIKSSAEILEKFGFSDFDIFDYILK